MAKHLKNRRQAIKAFAHISAGAAVVGTLRHSAALAQMPAPEPLKDDRLTFVATTETSAWQTGALFKPAFNWDILNLNVDPSRTLPGGRPMEGFGACFSDLGWTSLSTLNEQDRESVLRELFDPTAGARFTYCRMPIAANDFATEAYSYDETDGDFELKHFSIDHDKKTLIPFIKAAQRYQPKLRLWASPWTKRLWA
jgi:glucosylceramidase